MKFKRGLLYLGISLSFMLVASAIWLAYQEKPLYTHVFKTETGYGYSIIDHGKIIIKQEYIPAVASQLSFCSKEDAKNTGDLVLSKITKRMSPAITHEELQKIGIKFNCQN